MSKQVMFLRFLTILSIVAALALVACKSEVEPTEGTETGAAAEAPSAGEGAAVTVASQLAAADALDGDVDKVVTRCASCKLSMDGKAEHSLEVAGYTMHFCADGCKQRFEEDTEASILAMAIPK